MVTKKRIHKNLQNKTKKKQSPHQLVKPPTYNYFSETEFYPDKYVESLFAARGNWNRITKAELKTTDKPIHFIHVNGKYTLDKHLYGVKSELKNLIAEKKIVGNKNTLITNLAKYKNGKKYILETHDIDASQIMANPKLLEQYKKLFTKNKVFIFKPVSGYAGANIEIVKSYAELEKYMTRIIKRWSSNWKTGSIYYKDWVLQEYLADPLLFTVPNSKQGYKFHIRHYFIFRPGDKKSFYFKKGIIATALKPYIKGEWSNKDIHDTHFHGRDGEKFPDALKLSPVIMKKIYSQIHELYGIINDILKKNAKCFTESHNCFELFGADLMITKDYTIKILEFNYSPGLAYDDKDYVIDEKKSIIENYMSIIIDEYFPPLNKVENKFADDVVYVE
jgi:hypothetical protein